MFETSELKPVDIHVQMSDGSSRSVAVFDIEKQILSLLKDPHLMQKKHLAKGLDIFTGLENNESTHFGEIHTGDAWAAAVRHHIDQGKR